MKTEKFNLRGQNYCSPAIVVECVFTESGFAASDEKDRFDGTNGTEVMGMNPYDEL